MNRKYPSILLIALLNWGLIISSAEAVHPQAPLHTQNNSAAEELLPTRFSAKDYTPPRWGAPGRLQGGGAR